MSNIQKIPSNTLPDPGIKNETPCKAVALATTRPRRHVCLGAGMGDCNRFFGATMDLDFLFLACGSLSRISTSRLSPDEEAGRSRWLGLLAFVSRFSVEPPGIKKGSSHNPLWLLLNPLTQSLINSDERWTVRAGFTVHGVQVRSTPLRSRTPVVESLISSASKRPLLWNVFLE
uniref:SFRICE_001748 n=1 Tax=Spodoptera frugiperda TaxID=7108 RepID=A0A2H1V8H2_SPOFR